MTHMESSLPKSVLIDKETRGQKKGNEEFEEKEEMLGFYSGGTDNDLSLGGIRVEDV